jgi:hypothetical protein
LLDFAQAAFEREKFEDLNLLRDRNDEEKDG